MVVEVFEERGMEKNMVDNMPLEYPKKVCSIGGLSQEGFFTTRNHVIPLKYPSSTLANSTLIILFSEKC
jgi:hypothetical protein